MNSFTFPKVAGSSFIKGGNDSGDARNLTDLFQIRQQGHPRYMQSYTVRGDTVELTLENANDTALEISFAEAPYVCVRLYNETWLPAKPFFTAVKQYHERMT